MNARQLWLLASGLRQPPEVNSLSAAQPLFMANLFAHLPESLPAELVEVLGQSKHVRIERIVSQGHASPADFWYDQEQNEFVVVLRGAARLEFDDRSVDLTTGDYVLISAHLRHRVAWTSPAEPTIWLAIFFD